MNRFQHSSLSQTMAQMRRRYAARSSGGSTAPYTPYTPYTGEMPVTPPMNPRKRHHNIPVGMMGVEYRLESELKEAFTTIYTGEPQDDISRYQACNHLHSYGYNFDVLNVWGLAQFDPMKKLSRSKRNAKAWANYVKYVAETNNSLGGGNLKCLISRQLVGLHVARGWSIPEIKDYVRRLIDHILCDNLQDTVAGWYASDDGLREPDPTDPDEFRYSREKWREVLNAVQEVQREKKVNWPFYFADLLDVAGAENGLTEYWQVDGGEWVFKVPKQLKDWISVTPSDAHPVFMPYYYPWTGGNWDYGHNPPWRAWRVIMETLQEVFFPTAEEENAGEESTEGENSTPIHSNLKFHAILDASEKLKSKTDRTRATLVPPGHADMHKQIRVVSDLPNVEGIWFLGWNIDDSGADSRGIAASNWTGAGTDNRKWAEAIQNELHNTEAIETAKPGSNAILQNFPNPFTGGTRIPYHLAERNSFKIEIRTHPDDAPAPDPNDPNFEELRELGPIDRTLTEGYTGTSPQGKFENTDSTAVTGAPAPMPLRGTSAYWNGTNDNGATVDDARYRAYLYVGSERIGSIEMRKGENDNGGNGGM